MRLIVLASLVSLGLAGSARAECRQEDDAPATTRMEVINGKRTIVIEKDIIICGHPPRPAVAYVTSAKNVEYSWTQLTEDLAGKIVDSVKQFTRATGVADTRRATGVAGDGGGSK